MNLPCSFQHPGEPFTPGLANGACASIELRCGENVSHHPPCTRIPPTSRYSWSAIFLYVYTGQIMFSTFRSQAVASKKTKNGSFEDETKLPQDPSVTPPGAVTVEPCSPKSVYRLANKVRPASF